MLTVSKLARLCGLSRTTVLYYESIGLLRQAPRTAGNYRRYADSDLERLRQICSWRASGLTLADIRSILDQPAAGAPSILKRRLAEIATEIERLRQHQLAIARLLHQSGQYRSKQVMTKEKWVAIMRAAGLDDDAMRRWHVEFEKSAPADHAEFLRYLHIPEAEVKAIREWSQSASPAKN